MSTIGHPLSDVSNLIVPYTITARTATPRRNSRSAFRPSSPLAGQPTRAACVALYGAVSGHDLAADVPWGTAFAMFRDCVIFQGIGARYAVRQASSPKAKQVGEEMVPCAEIARGLVEEARGVIGSAKERL